MNTVRTAAYTADVYIYLHVYIRTQRSIIHKLHISILRIHKHKTVQWIVNLFAGCKAAGAWR